MAADFGFDLAVPESLDDLSGPLAALFGLGGAALASTLPLLFGAQLLIGLSQGVGYPVLIGMSIRRVEDANRTTATGLHQAVYAAGMFSGPWLSGIFADAIGVRPMFGLTSGAILLLSVLVTRQLVDGRQDDG